MSSQPLLTPGRGLILVGNLLYSIGAFAADFNVTHVYNPRWPPHARFHNGQTMSLGVLLSLTSLYFVFQPTAQRGMSIQRAKESLFWAATIGSFYCGAGLTAILYPGSEWKDPDIEVGGAQPILFSGVVGAMWVGYALEMWRMGDGKGKLL